MKYLPASNQTQLVRTDFTDHDAWQVICKQCTELSEADQAHFDEYAKLNADMGQPMEYQSPLEIINDRDFAYFTPEKLYKAIPKESDQACLLMADEKTFTHPEHPILVVDLIDQPGQMFRAIPSQIQTIEANLAIANMDWEDFADGIDEDGIFRGFGEFESDTHPNH